MKKKRKYKYGTKLNIETPEYALAQNDINVAKALEEGNSPLVNIMKAIGGVGMQFSLPQITGKELGVLGKSLNENIIQKLMAYGGEVGSKEKPPNKRYTQLKKWYDNLTEAQKQHLHSGAKNPKHKLNKGWEKSIAAYNEMKSYEPKRIEKEYKPKQEFAAIKKKSLLEEVAVWIRGNFFIPDARKFWIKPSINFLSQKFKETPFDLVITNGTPHSVHLIGLGLQNKFKFKWIADFRDPWTKVDYFDKLKLTKWAEKKHKKLENRVLKNADLVKTNLFTIYCRRNKNKNGLRN